MTRLAPGCKLNLGLRILDRRPDGYHSLESIFLPLPHPCDTLDLACAKTFDLQCDRPVQGDNILLKTWNLFCGAIGKEIGVHAVLRKRIPIGAGLGGASSDAASLLLWLNHHAPRPLDQPALQSLAARIGADVPFFLDNKPALVKGIGDKITLLRLSGKGAWLVLVCPEIFVSTKWAFDAYDEKALTTAPNGDNGKFAPQGAPNLCQNDLEAVVFQHFPILLRIKHMLVACGAACASMSGSGSSVFGLFYDRGIAENAASEFRSRFARVYFLHIRQMPDLAS